MTYFDTGGLEEKQEITYTYFEGLNALVAIFAMDNPDSFAELEDYIDKAFSYISEEDAADIIVMVLGTKSDLASGQVDEATA